MKWIFDVILLAILLFGLIRGYRLGLITLLFKRFRGLAALVLAFLLAKPAASLLKLTEKITDPVKSLLLEYVRDSAPAEMSDKVPTVIKSLANLFHVDITKFASDAANGGGDYADAFARATAEPLANALATVGAFLIVLAVAYVGLWIAGKLINAVFKLPVLKQINTLLGAVVGLFFFACFAWCLTKIAVFAFGIVPNAALLNSFDVQTTILGKLLYNLDPMKLLLSF